MKPSAVRYAVYGQVCFYGDLLVAVILKPQGLTANGGISYYGIYAETILPYILALLGSAYFTIKAAEQFTSPSLSVLKHSLTAMGLLIVGVMVTPDSLSAFMDGLHRACGIALFVLQLLLSFWLIMRLRYNFWAFILTGLEFAGGLASFAWLSPHHGYLLESQIVFQLSFGGLLIYALRQLRIMVPGG